MLFSFGQADRAISMLKATLEDMPADVHVRLKLKDIYLRCDMPTEAAEQYLLIARIYNERGDTERAKDYVVRARRLRSTSELSSSAAQPQRNTISKETDLTPGVASREEAATNAGAAASDSVFGGGRADQPIVEDISPVLPQPPVKPVEEHTWMDQPKLSEGESRNVVIKSPPNHESKREAPAAHSALFNSSLIKVTHNRRMHALMIGATCVVLLIAAAMLALRAYDAHLDRENEELVAAMIEPELAEPPPPDTLEGELSVEQDEGFSITVPLTPAVTQPSSEERQHSSDQAQEAKKSARFVEPVPLDTPIDSSGRTRVPPAISPISPEFERNNYRDSAGPTLSLPESGALPEPPPPNQIPRKSSEVIAGRILRRVEPEYPTVAKQARITGTVVVEISVDEQGNVSSARAQSGPQPLRAASLAAALRWKFQPSTLNGRPVRSISRIIFNFK
jgi:protein TonB